MGLYLCNFSLCVSLLSAHEISMHFKWNILGMKLLCRTPKRWGQQVRLFLNRHIEINTKEVENKPTSKPTVSTSGVVSHCLLPLKTKSPCRSKAFYSLGVLFILKKKNLEVKVYFKLINKIYWEDGFVFLILADFRDLMIFACFTHWVHKLSAVFCILLCFSSIMGLRKQWIRRNTRSDP